ncbi:MAG: tetratricopeptide repeat protein [Campylobacterales bacterium]|nr:tetratricopeptide repeat protein [Campylobacterales bacterium]
MTKFLLLSALLLPLSLFAEKSAFGAGDLDSPSPYGLTKTEKRIIEQKEKITDIEGTVRKNRNRIGSIEESVSGMKSIVEGLNEKSRNDKQELQSLKNDINEMKDSSAQMNQKIDDLVASYDDDFKKLKTVMGELSSLIDRINGTYVSKEEYNVLAKEINSFKTEVSKQLKNIGKVSSNAFDNRSNAQVDNDAEELFRKKKYADAIDAFEHLIAKHYKPARAHYYIGESYFQLNEYKNAIAYFKESAELYSKADYMPNLMLHTAISFEKIKDEEHAQQFFQALIAKYPDSPEAVKAKKFLK